MNEYSKYFIYGSEEKNIPGCIKMGISESTAKMIWEKMVKFASYAFNKSHATCYAALGARTAYLACHYPVEYTTGMLNSYIGNNEKISYYVAKCKRKGVTVLPPDINRSGIEFDVVVENGEKKIIFGLSGIKGVGDVAARAIIEERTQNGPFESLEDFLIRTAETKVNKKALEALILTGGFDCFGIGTRRALYLSIPEMLKLVKNTKKNNKLQITMFEDMFGSENNGYKLDIPVKTEYSPVDISLFEKDYLGYFVNHPMAAYSDKLNSWRSKKFLSDISEVRDEIDASIKKVYRKRIAGIVQDKKIITYTDKSGKTKHLIKFSLNDETGTINCVGFDDIATEYGYLVNDNSILYILCDGKKDDFGISCEIKAVHIFSEDERNKH